jgi:hypothetical protein
MSMGASISTIRRKVCYVPVDVLAVVSLLMRILEQGLCMSGIL